MNKTISISIALPSLLILLVLLIPFVIIHKLSVVLYKIYIPILNAVFAFFELKIRIKQNPYKAFTIIVKESK